MPSPNEPRPYIGAHELSDDPSAREPQPFLGGDDPWRVLQPEYEKILEEHRADLERQQLDSSDVVARALNTAAGRAFLDTLKVMVKAMPRNNYEQLLRRDAKMELVEWIEKEIERSLNR